MCDYKYFKWLTGVLREPLFFVEMFDKPQEFIIKMQIKELKGVAHYPYSSLSFSYYITISKYSFALLIIMPKNKMKILL